MSDKRYPERCDCWEAKAHRRDRSETAFWRRSHEQLTARIANLEAELALREHRDRTDVAWLQGKVVAQARELKRLNDEINVRYVRAGTEAPVPDVETDVIDRASVLDAHLAVRDGNQL